MGLGGNVGLLSDGQNLLWRDPQANGGYVPLLSKANLISELGNINQFPVNTIHQNSLISMSDLALQPVNSRLTEITLPNPYEGSQVNAPVHPSIVYIKESWNGYRYWMAFTPYPAYNNAYENPCVVASNNLVDWVALKLNPLVEKPSNGYNADPHLFLSPDKRIMYLAFRERLTGGNNSVKVMHTYDGITWTTPTSIISGATGSIDYASPSIWWNGSTWTMISHQLDAASPWPVRRNVSTTSNIYGAWGAATTVTIPAYTSRAWWHSYHQRLNSGQILALFQDNDQSVGSPGGLYFAESIDDGATYTIVGACAHTSKYRSTFFIDTQQETSSIDVFLSDFSTLKLYYCKLQPNAKLNRSALLARHQSLLATPLALPLGGIWADSCTRADSATLPGTADSGGVYTVSSGTWGISSNRLYPVATGRLLASSGTVNHAVSVQFVNMTAAVQQWLIARCVDASNYWRVGAAGVGGPPYPDGASPLVLQTIVGGFTNLNKIIGVISRGDLITLEAANSIIRVFVNGLLVHEEFCTVHNAGTQFGLQANSGATTFYKNLTCISSLL